VEFIITPSKLEGSIAIPGSKSHTIRALVFGLLAGGESVIASPLDSSDTRSCLAMARSFGAEVAEDDDAWRIGGLGGRIPAPDDVIDVGNSGTTLYIGMGVAALAEGRTVFTGDAQIRSRPAEGLIEALVSLGGEAFSTRGNGMPPLVVGGRLRGGRARIEAVTSQYLSSLLIAAPLAEGDTVIEVPLLNEKPYVTMTLTWLDRLGIRYEHDEYRSFMIPGSQACSGFRARIPGDFSSATFFAVAAAVTASELILEGLDWNDTQGDREALSILDEMGAAIEIGEGRIRIKGGSLKGGTFDLNAIPDALPALAVAGCLAEGETRLVNVPQARLKETDRIRVMREELSKMGADIKELPDGLVIRGGTLRGARVNGRHDHRAVMALAVAGLAARGDTVVETAESAAVTFPGFRDLMASIGADIRTGA
jgi:3-phosphoshikimate 1-carboxyvinyltransferase